VALQQHPHRRQSRGPTPPRGVCDAPYDNFLDQWTAEDFDAVGLMELVVATGEGYFVPTTKHHDGVTLWDAPGTGGPG
jgi:hypothetical protein